MGSVLAAEAVVMPESVVAVAVAVAPLPDTADEVAAWLKGEELADAFDAIRAAGLADAKGLHALAAAGVKDLTDSLGLSTAVAFKLKAALAPFAVASVSASLS